MRAASTRAQVSSSQWRCAHPDLSRVEEFLEGFFFVNSLEAIPRHVARNIRSVRAYLSSEGIRTVSAITTPSIQEWIIRLAGRGLKPHTLRNYLSSLSRFCSYLVSAGVTSTNPCRGVTMPPKSKDPPRYLSALDYDRALVLARKHGIYCEVCVALKTGLRMTELRLLEWRDVDFDAKKLMVRRTKDRGYRVVPLHSEALAALWDQHKVSGNRPLVVSGGRRRKDGKSGEGPWTLNQPRGERWWLQALIPLQEKISPFQSIAPGSVGRGWHLLRHTFASRAVQAGVPIFTVSNWLGHKDVKTTMIYAHLSPDYDPRIELV